LERGSSGTDNHVYRYASNAEVMEIKICPCCGGVPEIEVTVCDAYVRCLDCGLKIKRPSEDLAGVIAAWNRRIKLGLATG
jgi:hypothetical protein